MVSRLLTLVARTTRALPALLLGTAAALSAPPAYAQGASELNVYTVRNKDLVEPLLRVFESLARVKLNIVYVTDDPIARLEADAGKADLFIAAELSQLVDAKAKGLTTPAADAEFAGRIPASYKDSGGHWFGLTSRLRIVAAARDRVAQKEFTYEELATPKWKGKLCVRSGLHPYNVGLVASIVAHKGAPAAEAWLKGLKANLAAKPTGGDRDQIAFVAAGKCDIALVNTYYIGLLRGSSGNAEQQKTGNAVNVIFPNAADRGAHVSVSGMALMKGAKNAAAARLLMDFMTSEPAQYIYGHDNHEYPIRADVNPSGLVESWGKPKLDELPLDSLVKFRTQAIDLIKKVDFDNVP
jgi:iron(III) transport system substrate-binding protein